MRAAVVVTVLVLPVAGGCLHGDGHDAAAPASLYDGTPARVVPAELAELPKPAVLGRVRVTPAGKLGARGRACLARASPPPVAPTAPVVLRTGAVAETLTILDRAGRSLRACEDAPRELEGHGAWCGGVSGRLHRGRLRDARVELSNCRSSAGETIGFAWITPRPATRWIAVEEPGYFEVYETAGELPVRVSTSGVRPAEAKVVFEYREYDAAGRELARKTMNAGVAG